MSTETIKIISCNESKTKCQAVILTQLKNGKKTSRTIHCVKKQGKWIGKTGDKWVEPQIKSNVSEIGEDSEVTVAGYYEPVFAEIAGISI